MPRLYSRGSASSWLSREVVVEEEERQALGALDPWCAAAVRQ